MNTGISKFNAVTENIRALDAKTKNENWMLARPQLCWKCQKDKDIRKGSIKFFGNVRRFICCDCVLAKQVALKNIEGTND
jgi:hypothetical protein